MFSSFISLDKTESCKIPGLKFPFFLVHRTCLFRQDTDQLTFNMPIPDNPEPVHPDLDSMLSRKFGKEVANYFAGLS